MVAGKQCEGARWLRRLFGGWVSRVWCESEREGSMPIGGRDAGRSGGTELGTEIGTGLGVGPSAAA